jgi:hypothetical protein
MIVYFRTAAPYNNYISELQRQDNNASKQQATVQRSKRFQRECKTTIDVVDGRFYQSMHLVYTILVYQNASQHLQVCKTTY